MKLIYLNVIIFSVGYLLLSFFNFGYFALFFALSVLPISILHGRRELKEFHQDNKKYKGWLILTYPPIIFFFLVLTHKMWLL